MFLVLNGFSQNNSSNIIKDNQLWIGYYNSIILNQKWSINSDFQFRTRNEIKHYSQVLIRSDISFKPKERITIALGLAHFRFFITDNKTRGEWRPWQELKLTDKLNKLRMSHRFRVEQRLNELVENNEPTNDYQFNFRFRYRIDLRYPIIKEKETGNNMYVLIGNEIMINAGKIITYNYFDQNRLYTGLNYEVNKKLSLQIQYMHNCQQSSNGLILNSNKVLRFNIYQTINL